jgi:hypothetical protein
MYSGYLKMSGIELVNHDRFKAYMAAGLGNGVMPADDCGCPDLTASFDDPGPYGLPHTDTAPWYDPARPESAHFAGMMIEEIGGMDSPYNSRTVERAQIGGALGGLTLGPRILPMRATLFALSQPALDYGLQWVTAMLSGRMCGATTFCNLGDLEFFSACPDSAQGSQCAGGGIPIVDETSLDLARTMFSGGLVDGPTVVNKFNRGRQVVAYEIVFTLATESPYMAGTDELELNAVSLTQFGAVGAESWVCPGFDDPCAGLDPVTGPRTACVSSVEDTCDWDESQQLGPPSWATQSWTATNEEVLEEGAPCSMTLTRTGDAGIDGCTRPSVRCQFSSAVGGFGPVSVEFDVTEAQGNLLVALWNPATDTNIPVSSLQKPTGTGGRVFAEPTGDAVNALGAGHFRIEYALPVGVDPGTLYLIFHAFGGTNPSGGPQDETVTNVYMNYWAVDAGANTCCNLEPGDPIVASTYEVPCYEAPSSMHRQVASVANNALTTERALRFQVVNTDLADPILNARIAVYDPTLIGQAASAVPTTGGTWPGGVEEWECNALIGDMYLPEIPAGTTVEIDGRRRQILKYANGSPGEAVSGDRLVYGGGEKPWTFQTIPPCKTYAVVVFADGANTPGGTVTVAAADLHLVSGVAA